MYFIVEAWRMARAERLEQWSRDDNIILERSPEEDERRFEVTLEEREIKYQARIAAEEQKKLEAQKQKQLGNCVFNNKFLESPKKVTCKHSASYIRSQNTDFSSRFYPPPFFF